MQGQGSSSSREEDSNASLRGCLVVIILLSRFDPPLSSQCDYLELGWCGRSNSFGFS
jgi:hypothetical protein